MSIASRIEEMEGHIDNIYDTLELGGENIYLLPKEYIQVEYIQSSGTQYIDTGYSFNDNLNVEIKFQGLDTASSYYGVFGTRESDTTTRFVISYRGDSKKIALNYRNGDTSSINNTDVETNPVVVYNNGKQFYLDNANIYTFSNGCGTGTRNCLLFTFANVDGSLYNKASMKLYYCKMYDNGVLKRNFIPCYRTSDSVIGLYDLVEGKFYINAGTGSFIYGSVSREHENKNIVNINNSLMNRYKDFLAHGVDELWNNWEKVNGTGETLSLTPTIKGKMKVELKGNTYQYSDENLFNKTARQGNTANTTTTNRIYFDNIIYVKQGESYILSTDLDTSVFRYAINININPTPRTGSADWDTGWKTTSSITFTAPINGYIGVPVSRINDSSIAPNDITNVHWELKKSAPSPDYPQDIQVVSGDNSIKVEGKNLLNPSDVIASNKTTISGEEITINDDSTWAAGYVICGDKITSETYKISSIGNTGQLRLLVRGYKNGDIYASGLPQSAAYSSYYGASVFDYFTNDISLTLDNTCDYYYVGIALYRQGSETFKLQVEKGTTATTYTPYVSQTYPISLGNIELCKIGDYKDRIYYSSGKWYLEKNIGKVVLDGSEAWAKHGGIASWFYYDGVIDGYYNNNEDGFALCYYFVQNKYSSVTTLTNGQFAYGTTDGGVTHRLVFKDTDYTDTADFKNWLSTHNTIVYYVLATPTTEEITDSTLISQLEAIKYSYNEQTNISQVNDDMPFMLDIIALKEITATTPLASLSVSRALLISDNASSVELNEEEAEVNTESIEEDEENIIEEENINETEEVNER